MHKTHFWTKSILRNYFSSGNLVEISTTEGAEAYICATRKWLRRRGFTHFSRRLPHSKMSVYGRWMPISELPEGLFHAAFGVPRDRITSTESQGSVPCDSTQGDCFWTDCEIGFGGGQNSQAKNPGVASKKIEIALLTAARRFWYYSWCSA